MKKINNYILEKLKINKDIKIKSDDRRFWDAKMFQKDDILFSNPNISRPLSTEFSKPGFPSFYKVTDTKNNKVKIAPIGYKLISGDRKKGECMPDDSHIYKDCWLKIDDDFIYYGGNALYLWDGTPVKFYN